MGKFPLGLPIACLKMGIHLRPERQHFGMLMCESESSIYPGEDLNVGGFVGMPKNLRPVVGDEAESVKRGPMSGQESLELLLSIGADSVRADDRFISHTANC